MSNLIKENRRKIVKDDHINEGEKFVGKDLRLSELKEEKNLMGVVLSLADDQELYVAVSPYQDLDTTFYTTASIDISNKYVLIGEADELTVRDCQLDNIEMFDTQEKAIEKTKTYYKKMSVGDEEPLKREYKLFASDGSEESRRFKSIEEAEKALRNEGSKFKNSKDGEYKYELICYSYDNNTGKVYQDKLNEYIITVSNGTVKAKKRKIAEMKDGCVKDSEEYNDGTYYDVDVVGLRMYVYNIKNISSKGNSIIDCDLEFESVPVALRDVKNRLLTSANIDICMKNSIIALDFNFFDYAEKLYNNKKIKKLLKNGKDIRPFINTFGDFDEHIDQVKLGSVILDKIININYYSKNEYKIKEEQLKKAVETVLFRDFNEVVKTLELKSNFNEKMKKELIEYLQQLANSPYRDSCTNDGDVNDTYLEDDIDCGGDILVQPNGDVIVVVEYEGDGGDNSTSRVNLDKETFFEMVNEMYDYKYEDITDTNELLKALDNEPNFNDMENEFWKKVYKIDLDNAEKELEEAE